MTRREKKILLKLKEKDAPKKILEQFEKRSYLEGFGKSKVDFKQS